MNEYEKNELSAAISLMLEELRPDSMQAKVLEAMVNKPANGLPRMTYDLEISNVQFGGGSPEFQVPSIWELIGLDVAPYPGLWEQMDFARSNSKAIRNAVYGLKDKFEALFDSYDDEGNPVGISCSLYIFNKNGPNTRDINVVTPVPSYSDARLNCEGKQSNQIRSRVKKITTRSRIAGKDGALIIRELATVLTDATRSASLPPHLGDEIKRIERGGR